MSNELQLFQLLKIIKFERNLQSLIRTGMSYKHIADFAELASKQGLIALTEKGVMLTADGEIRYLELREINKRTNKNEWIEEEQDSKIEPLGQDFIFLPDQNELFF
jgi:hypothetical protein